MMGTRLTAAVHAMSGTTLARAVRLAGALAIASALASGCGYSLAGRGSFLPDYIRTIGVPQFVNQTVIFDLDRFVTDRVRTEFLSRGRYKVEPQAENVDAVLTCSLKSAALTPIAFNNATNLATRYAVIISATVEFKDLKADKVLWSNPGLVFREEYDVGTSANATDPAAFFGDNQNALTRLAQDFAKSIVTSILEAF